jgi:uncharacterized protein YkwD
MYPKKFGEIYKFGKDTLKMKKNFYIGGLIYAFNHLKARKPLLPNFKAYDAAECHATTGGQVGHLGHDRIDPTCRDKFCPDKFHIFAENISYGYDKPISIVLHLLVDENTPSLGHRRNIFDSNLIGIGVSIKPHTKYKHHCVMCFY